MGSLHDAVIQYVEREMKKDPGVKNATLFAGAREIDESIGELRPQQFHARYRLPVTRRMAEERQPARQRKADLVPDPAPVESGDGAAVMEYVERTLEANPGVTNADLLAGAREIDPSVGQLTGRQFHARYPLQVKARLARAAAPEPRTLPEPEAPAAEETTAQDPPPVKEGDPVAVRGLLLDLARELASAESKAEVIEVMARLDEYVAEIMKAARG